MSSIPVGAYTWTFGRSRGCASVFLRSSISLTIRRKLCATARLQDVLVEANDIWFAKDEIEVFQGLSGPDSD